MSTALRFSSICLRCGAIDCVADECTGFGEVPVEPSDDETRCAADVELERAWDFGK